MQDELGREVADVQDPAIGVDGVDGDVGPVFDLAKHRIPVRECLPTNALISE